MAAISTNPPEEVSKVTVQQVQEVLALKDHRIRELQGSRLCDDQWSSIPYPIPNLVRSSDAIVDNTGNNVFLREAKSDPAKLYQLQISNGEWKQPIENTATLTWSMIYYNEVIMIGGVNKGISQCTSGLIGVRPDVDGTLRQERIFQDMPTRRCRTTALVYTDPQSGASYIIVIGGEDDNEGFLTTVEIFEATAPNKGWCYAKDIPEALSGSSGAIARGYLYLLGGYYKRDHPTSAVYRCKVDELIAHCQLVMPFQKNKPINKVVWEKLPDLPVHEATCTSFHDTLVVVGGTSNKITIGDIRFYNEHYKRWEVIGYLRHPRYLCFAIGLPDKLIVFGGKKSNTKSVDYLEIYTHYHCQQ